MSDNALVKLCGIARYYGEGPQKVKALGPLDLTFNNGDFVCVAGVSGSGKTTLLNAIGALDSIDSGKIYLDETDITTLDDEARTELRLTQMGFVFQSYNLVPVLSVEENIGFIMKLRGFSDKEINERVLEIASLLKIDNKLKLLPNELSGGQQQRVAVARAVAVKPKIILADEPTANLDSKNSQILIDMMRELNKNEGMSILFASHDDLIMESARRVVELNDGVLVDDNKR